MDTSVGCSRRPSPPALPDDDLRQVLWRFASRPDLRAVIRAARATARGPVARLVAQGGRHSLEWTAEKEALSRAFDAAGLTGLSLDPEEGGSIDGPKNLALALAAFELAWVDAGAATTLLAQHLALAPIVAFGTDAQRRQYLRAAAGTGDEPARRGAFALTEPIPYAGVDTGLLGGKVRVVEWRDGREPLLQIDKRGRFITNMASADFVTAVVDSADERIDGRAVVVLEADDPGTFDRGVVTRKLVHQLSSTGDPVFSLRVPASRIVGGYQVRDGVIVPNCSPAEILDRVFPRSRVTVGLMTTAKLLSAVEPILRYHRERFRGADTVSPGTPRHELGLQQREDALHRLVDIWATGEAAASLGFATARLFDEIDGARRQAQGSAGEAGADGRSAEAVAAVLSPACKLWNTGHGAAMMREAVSLMGGYGVTEDCPGFLGYKWMDAQLEATYEGPEAVQRAQLASAMTDAAFLTQFRAWAAEMRRVAARRPGTGACTVATAMELWLWTLRHLQAATDANGQRLYQGSRQGVTFPLADALCWLLASRCQVLDVLELESAASPDSAWAGLLPLLTDLSHVQAARAGGEVGRIAAELVNGYNRHPAWDAEGCARCYGEEELAGLEQLIPGIESTAGSYADIIAADGAHPDKAGPCVRFAGLDAFTRLRGKLDGCLTGARLAKDRAAAALTQIRIPDAPDYPRAAE